jgi:prepilin-type N-terminal cleavage/methylation domain-containing protein
MKSQEPSGRGFSLTEVLVVIGVIVVLLGLLFPALAEIRKSGLMTKSMAHMRQIGTWMGLYSQDNRDFIVPSQFNYDYEDGGYKGKVRSVITSEVGTEHQGTWSDILWTVFEVGVFPEAEAALGHDYRYDSPDLCLYGRIVGEDKETTFTDNIGAGYDNPLRSAAENTRNAGDYLPTPWGCGAIEAGLPGYFAANNFFATPGTETACPPHETDEEFDREWYTNGQIRMPERSMYLVDSVAGETIEPQPKPYLSNDPDEYDTYGRTQGEVDFRYSEMCLMLFLDGHVEPQGKFQDLADLEGPHGRGIRIRQLTKRSPDPAP